MVGEIVSLEDLHHPKERLPLGAECQLAPLLNRGSQKNVNHD